MSLAISYRPIDGQVVGTVRETCAGDASAAVTRASSVAGVVARTSPVQRAAWLGAVADALEAHRQELAVLADLETGLGMPRLESEVNRAAAQLRFYAAGAEEGSFLGVTVDTATETTPQLVRVREPLGPVAVFGASNFPLAFGVVGNDTASALAAGCPVVAKAHPAHVLLSVRLAELAAEALAGAGAPKGTFDVVVGMEPGVALVRHPEVAAVGFTGSLAGGMALWRLSNEREVVIPVYAEMGTVNPVVMTSASTTRLADVATGFVTSFTMGSGQFCTKPGMLFAPAGHGVAAAVAQALERAAPSPTMLTEGIAASARAGVARLRAAGARVVGTAAGSGRGWSADAVVLEVPSTAITPGSALLEECFAPVAVVVEYADTAALHAALANLQGSLVGTVITDATGNDEEAPELVSRLAARVGRMTVDDWPTGVAWTWAQHHGGPWPSTSAPAATSVGAAALDRWVRPVTYQSVPDAWLPEAARTANPWRVPRRVNGRMELP